MNKILLLSFILYSSLVFARELQCTKFDNNKIRCLAKKGCRWIDAPGANVDLGICTYKDIPENQQEIQKYKTELEGKEACLKALTQYKNEREMMVRAEINNDATSVAYQQERMNKQLDIIKNIEGCAEIGEDLELKFESKKEDEKPIK